MAQENKSVSLTLNRIYNIPQVFIHFYDIFHSYKFKECCSVLQEQSTVLRNHQYSLALVIQPCSMARTGVLIIPYVYKPGSLQLGKKHMLGPQTQIPAHSRR